MTRPARLKLSRSLRLYAQLLELYPPSFLQRHRMLQNFADLEDAAETKAKLWLLIGKDLAMSLMSHFFRVTAWPLHDCCPCYVDIDLRDRVFLLRPDAGPSGFACAFAGFLPGLPAMYLATRLYGTPQSSISHFFRSGFDKYVIGIFVTWILLFVIGYYFYGTTRGHPALEVFGGFLLGMLAMHIATHVYGMP
jgi:hypothetical protein